MGSFNIIKNNLCVYIKHHSESTSKNTLNANKIGFLENLLRDYGLPSRYYNYFTCPFDSKLLIVHQSDCLFHQRKHENVPDLPLTAV